MTTLFSIEETATPQPAPRKVERIVFKILLEGGTVAPFGNRFTARDQKLSPVVRFSSRTWNNIKILCRKQKGVWLLDRREVRRLHGNTWFKQAYKIQLVKEKLPLEIPIKHIPGGKIIFQGPGKPSKKMLETMNAFAEGLKTKK